LYKVINLFNMNIGFINFTHEAGIDIFLLKKTAGMIVKERTVPNEKGGHDEAD